MKEGELSNKFMSNSNKFFKESEKNELMNSILNTDYNSEDSVWDLALELEHISILLRTNVIKCGENEKYNG